MYNCIKFGTAMWIVRLVLLNQLYTGNHFNLYPPPLHAFIVWTGKTLLHFTFLCFTVGTWHNTARHDSHMDSGISRNIWMWSTQLQDQWHIYWNVRCLKEGGIPPSVRDLARRSRPRSYCSFSPPDHRIDHRLLIPIIQTYTHLWICDQLYHT